jgi:hypothetical protein
LSNSCHSVSQVFFSKPAIETLFEISQVRFIPSWSPGAGFKRKARAAGKEMARLEGVPFERATDQIVCKICHLPPSVTLNLYYKSTGDYIQSFASKHLIEDDGRFADPLKQHHIKWACGALYVGGGDTVRIQMMLWINII